MLGVSLVRTIQIVFQPLFITPRGQTITPNVQVNSSVDLLLDVFGFFEKASLATARRGSAAWRRSPLAMNVGEEILG